LLSSGKLSGADEQRTSAALAGIYFQQKNYAQAAKVAQRYLKSGGSDPDMRTLLVQSYYLSNDCASVVTLLKPGIDAQVHAGHAPDESQLQLLGTCAQRVKDDATYRSALEKLVAYHPKQSYWDDLFSAIRNKPGYSSKLDIDTYRLRRATGSLSTADDYMEMTQLAIVAGTTAEGKQVIDQGFTSGVLGRDAQADREKRLQALAAKRAQAPADPANPVAPVDMGFNQVFAGQAKQGLAAMDAAIAKGGLDHPDQAQLHLGEAYYMAGDKARAVQTFRAVKGTDGSADLARLWVLVASK
jgi:tetratricopeptide (TPR) repeat protein